MEPNSTSLMAHLVITQVRLQTVVRVSKRYNISMSRAQGRFKGCVGKALPPPSLQCFQVMCADDIELSLMVLRVPHLSPTFEWKSIILSLYCLALPRHR
jgi:hypothetical protein